MYYSGGITTCHKMRHSLSLPTVTYICMAELPHFQHSLTTSFLHSQPIQTPPSGPGLVCADGQMFLRNDLTYQSLLTIYESFIYLLLRQDSTFRINYSVFQSGPVSPKVDKQHGNVYITYTINDKVNKMSVKLT